MNAPQGRSPSSPPVRWLWVALGVVLGAALIATVVPIVEDIPPRPDVAVLVGALTFVLMGILVGYHSPGRTIREAAIAGGVLAVATPVVLRAAFGFVLPPSTTALGVVAGFGLSAAGGWVGELMQGTIDDGDRESFQWAWVGAGTVLGVMLSIHSVFVLRSLMELTPLGTLLAFLASFFATAFVIAFFSPGSTILEPATAAALVIFIDAMLALAGFRAPFPFMAVAVAAVMGYAVALAGGYLGEVAHNFRYGTAWGGVEMGKAAPKPGESA